MVPMMLQVTLMLLHRVQMMFELTQHILAREI